VLKALSFSAANSRDSGLVVLHNGTTPHDSFPADLRSAATMNNIIASSVHFVVCFVGTEALSDVGHLVHSLYHSLFEEYSDRQSMLPVLQKGETIAVLNREKTEAISAITFLARSNSAVVLFLATLTNYTSLGMASFLFSLSHIVIWVRGKGYNSYVSESTYRIE
jgi:hypothetical protein